MPDSSTPDRATLRRQLLGARADWSKTSEAEAAQVLLAQRLTDILAQLEPMCLGLYWPMQGEFNPRDVAVQASRDLGCQLALPFAKKIPVEMHYLHWNGQTPTAVDECKIPCADGRPVEPDVVLVPCLGFNQEGFRLGYGGGYFDRYLAKHPGTTAIGLAWEIGLLNNSALTPQAHDLSLMAVLTERNIFSS